MKVKLLVMVCWMLAVAGCMQTTSQTATITTGTAPPPALSDDPTYLTARKRVHDRIEAGTRTGQARHVILFIGDGMGVSTVTAARILQGQLRGENGEENYLSFEHFPYTALSKTYNTDLQVPDSAGTMSAIMTGLKSRGGTLSTNPDNPRGKCVAADANRSETFLELAASRGLATGIVSTARITHATPAATYAHSPERNWEADATMPEAALAKGCEDIASQLVQFQYGNGIDVILGGGRRFFLPENAVDPENHQATGVRKDNRNLIEEWQKRYSDGLFVWNERQFTALNSSQPHHLLGLFESSHMRFEADREQDVAGEPSLAEMTEQAIVTLKKNAHGFFLMVEGGRIDHAHHLGNAYRALTDTIAFSDAVAVADRLTDDTDTLIIVTADHSHTMTINGYPRRGNPILGKVVGPNGKLLLASDGLPYTTLSYANGPGYSKERQDLTHVDTEAPDYRQQATFPLAAETHGGEDVVIYAKGPGSDLLRGVVEQNEIFHVMLEASTVSSTEAAPQSVAKTNE